MRVHVAAWLALLLCTPSYAAGFQSGTAETVVEVRVHGNHTTPDQEILRLAGIAVGEPLPPGTIAQVAARLRASGRFRRVEVRKRYRSLQTTNEVALVLIVEEGGRRGPLPGPIGRMTDQLMFSPLLSYRDGYGLSYGARTTVVEPFGPRSRASVPLTWGARKRAALELDKTLRTRWLHRLEGGVSIASQENPHFRIDEEHVRLWARAERALAPGVRIGAGSAWHDVEFGDEADRYVSYTADVTFDTRTDPTFPRDAIYTSFGWEALDFDARPTAHRTWVDARGYLGLIRQSVLSVRARYDRATRALPSYAQRLLGGASSLRGFRAGTFAGDDLLTTSVELRLPITSPLDAGRAGVSIFWDAGAVATDGERLRDQRFHHGAGAGVFLQVLFFQINVDVAHGFDNRTRLHVMSGFAF